MQQAKTGDKTSSASRPRLLSFARIDLEAGNANVRILPCLVGLIQIALGQCP